MPLSFIVVAVIVFLSFLNYKLTTNRLSDIYSQQNQFITISVKSLLSFRDVSIEALENSIDLRMRELSNVLVNQKFANTQNIEKADLYKMQTELSMDPENEDIYIIDATGLIVNTSFRKDLNLNFNQFGPKHEAFLKKIREQSGFTRDRLTKESNTDKTRIYSYQATCDKTYVVELGFYSSKITELDKQFQAKLSELIAQFEHVKSIQLFIASDEMYGFSRQDVVNETHTPDFVKQLKTEKHIRQEVSETANTVHNDYYFIEMKNTELYDGYVIEITSDDAKLQTAKYLEIILQLSSAIIVILILITAIHFYLFKIKKSIHHFSENILYRKKLNNNNIDNDPYFFELTNIQQFISNEINHLEEQKSKSSLQINDLQSVKSFQNTDNQFKNQLLNKYSHTILNEFRNPFFTLLTIIQQIDNKYDSATKDDIKKQVLLLDKNAKTAYDILFNVIEWSKINLHTNDNQLTTIQLQWLIDKTLVSFKNNIQKKEINFTSNVNSNTLVLSNIHFLWVIIRTIISYIIKFSYKGAELTFSEISDEKNNSVTLILKEIGGSAIINHLRETCENLKTTDNQSNGLGILLCMEYLKLTNSTLQLTPENVAGNEIWMNIPKSNHEISEIPASFETNLNFLTNI